MNSLNTENVVKNVPKLFWTLEEGAEGSINKIFWPWQKLYENIARLTFTGSICKELLVLILLFEVEKHVILFPKKYKRYSVTLLENGSHFDWTLVRHIMVSPPQSSNISGFLFHPQKLKNKQIFPCTSTYLNHPFIKNSWLIRKG